jgi:hypothetical protein
VRLANFQDDILKPIAGKLSITYGSPELTNEHVQSWIPAINERMEEAFETLDLPELRATEERAFRTVWNSTGQFLRSNPAMPGAGPDELLYLPNQSYYQVLSDAPDDPPVGTLPTDTTYFEPIVIAYPFIDFDQRGRQAVGEVLGVYRGKPHFQTCGNGGWTGLPFRLSERGIEIKNTSGFSAWLHYRIRPPKYTAEPWDVDRTYQKGSLVFRAADGNVYRSLTSNTGVEPPATTSWALVPVPSALTAFVTNAVASDLIDDLATAQKYYGQAQAALVRRYDSLRAQGEGKSYRLYPRRRALAGCWCDSLLWCPTDGTELTTLTDIWQDEGGSVVSPIPGPATESGLADLVNEQDYIDLTFEDRGSTSWRLEGAIENDTDEEDTLEKLWITTITLRTSSSCRVWLNSAPTSENYKLRYEVK